MGAKKNQGDVKAQYNLGVIYEKGKGGVRKDYKKAVELYRKSADQGFAPSQSNLGNMYSQGLGVKQDYKKAVELYKKSADQGDAEAQHNLGLMYVQGLGVKQDYKKAKELWQKSAEQGVVNAKRNLATLCQKYSWVCTQ